MAPTYGSQQMLLTGTTVLFPTNGRGGTAASAGVAFPSTGRYVAEALTVRVVPLTGNDTVTILAGDGTTSMCSVIVPTTVVIGQYIPIGGVYGYDTGSLLGISAQITQGGTAGTYTLWFRQIPT